MQTIGLQNVARGNSVAIGKETVAGNKRDIVAYRSTSGVNTDSVDNVSSATSADVIGVNQTNSTANSLLLGNGSYTNIRANSTCDLGTVSVPFQNIYSNASLFGPSNSRTVDNIVSNTGTGTLNNVVSFVSDKVIKDSGIASSTLSGGPFLPLAGGTMNLGATINANSSSITNLTNLNGKTANDLVTGPASAVGGNVCSFFAASGKIIVDRVEH